MKEILAASLLLLIGCSRGLNTVLEARERGEGTPQEYAVLDDAAWDIARSVLRWQGAGTFEEHKMSGYLLTTMEHDGGFSGAALCGVWFEKVADQAMRITIISRRREPLNAAIRMTEGTFHRLFGKGLAIVKEGKPLPLRQPD